MGIPTVERKILQVANKGGAPWEILPGERVEWFDAFRLYRDMGPDRDLKTVAGDTGAAVATVRQWREKWDWDTRVRAWECHLDVIRQKATEKIVASMAQRQAKLGQQMQELGKARIQKFLDSPALQESMTVADATRVIAEGVKIERLAEGETTGREDQTLIFHIGDMPLPKWAEKSRYLSSGSDSPPSDPEPPVIQGEVVSGS